MIDNDHEIQALYREAASAQPGPALDRRILDAAHEEIAARNDTRRMASPWWKRWLPAGSAIAATVIGLSITLRMGQEQSRLDGALVPAAETALPAVSENTSSLRQEKSSAANERADRVPDAVQHAPPQEQARKALTPHAPAAKLSDADAPRDSASIASESAAPSPQLGAGAPLSKSRVENAAPQAPMRAQPVEADKEMKSEPTRLRAGAPAKADAETGTISAGHINGAGSAATIDAPAQEWLTRIRVLLAKGQRAEAVQSLLRFREAYPAYKLPADLADLK